MLETDDLSSPVHVIVKVTSEVIGFDACDPESPVHASPLLPFTEQVLELVEVHDIFVVSPDLTNFGEADMDVVGGRGGIQVPPRHPPGQCSINVWSHVADW